MAEWTKQLPEIIRAAAQSNLGIVALMALLLSFLAYAFFRKSSDKWKFASFALLLVGGMAFGIAMFRSLDAINEKKTSSKTNEKSSEIGVATPDLASSTEQWIREAEKAKKSATVAPGRPLPADLVEARSRFEKSWRDTSKAAKEITDQRRTGLALSYVCQLYRLEESDSPTQPNATAWADEAVRYFEDVQQPKQLTEALLDKAAIYLDLAQLNHTNQDTFERLARDGDAVVTRAYQTADKDQKVQVLRLTSRFYYYLARPKSFRLSDTWDNNYLLLAYQKAKDAYDLSANDRKTLNQLVRTLIKVSKNPPQSQDPQWTSKLRDAKERFRAGLQSDKERLITVEQRISPLHVLGVATLELIIREWQSLPVGERKGRADSFLQELESDSIAPLREATALLRNSELSSAYGFDLYYDLSRALSVKTIIVLLASPGQAPNVFLEVERNFAKARENAKASQLDSAKQDIDREATFHLLSLPRKNRLREILQGST